MATNSNIFRESILSALLPVFRAKGFETWKPKGRSETPIVHLRRRIANRRDLIDIQFDKYGRFGCFVNLAQIEGDEVATMYEGVLPADQIQTGHLTERCRLRGNSLFEMFKPPLYLRLLKPARLGEVVAQEILSRFNEAEEWFTSKRIGKHIRCRKLSPNAIA